MAKRMAKPHRPVGLAGPEGIVAAVIHQAIADATGDDADEIIDALAYIGGRQYQHHVTALGLPDDIIPACLEDAGNVDRLIDLVLGHERTKRN